MRRPKFTISLPTYNAACDLPRCLENIRGQDYPTELVEVLVADGRSSDDTVNIARRFGATVLDNPRRLADYGAKLIAGAATGDLLVIFAADNGFETRHWLDRVAAQFVRYPDLAAVWGRLISGPDDPPINKYYELIQSDPLAFFLNKNLDRYLREAPDGGDAYVFTVDPRRPVIWGANGLVYRLAYVRDIILRDEFLGDNDIFQCMIERGQSRVAYIPSLRTYHHHVRSLRQWIGKWRRNYTLHFLEHYDSRNLNWVYAGGIRWKMAIWLLYSLLPLISGAHALTLALRDRNAHWLYHPIVAFCQTVCYAYHTVRSGAGRRLIGALVLRGRPRCASAS
jgi:glycosyltransferase involved in cell wall biosynthesis